MAASKSQDSGINLPKGGGAIRGVGESFQAQPFTGTGSFSVPIDTSPGRRGFGPTLRLEYSAAHGNGPFGLGWKLSLPCITRKTEKGLPRYDDRDAFVLSGCEDLVPVGAAQQRDGFEVQRYQPRTEATFARIERWRRPAGETHWRAITRDDITSVYGRTPQARLADPEDENRVFQWLIEESFDAYGNHMAYQYAGDSGRDAQAIYEQGRVCTQRYLRRVCYGNLAMPVDYPGGSAVGCELGGRRYAFELVFDFGDWDLPTRLPHPAPAAGSPEDLSSSAPRRPDAFSSFDARFDVRTARRCRRALMFHHFAELGAPRLVRSTDFDYQVDADTRLAFLDSVALTAYDLDAGGAYVSASMPPVSFEYTRFTPEAQRHRTLRARGDDMPGAPLGKTDMVMLDLSGDGLPDLVQGRDSAFRYWRNLGAGLFDRPRGMPWIPPGVSLSAPGVAFADQAGDARTDLLLGEAPLPGFFESTSRGAWRTFRPFRAQPSFDPGDPAVRMLDLTGDGLSDALMTTGEHFLWFQSLGERGFAAPEKIARRHDADVFPDVYFNDPDGRVRLACMHGGGLNDIVLVRADRIEYWPNLGYGRFGRRTVMANAPHLGVDFEPRRLFLVDLNGTGCADLVYVENDRVHFWFNQSGNAWSERHTIRGTPHVDDLGSLAFGDVFGTGTATLVWSQPFRGQPQGSYQALDFCGGAKPYLLSAMSNGVGATTRVRYAPSTRFSLEDRARGRPWITELPFPVHVVDTVEVVDHITRNKLVTRYRYHHGYYDGHEREFRGFARVDQIDSESFEDFAAPGLGGLGSPSNGDAACFVPPVETRTWFHTGVYFDEDSAVASTGAFDARELTRRLREEFYAGDTRAQPPAEHRVPRESAREAMRALTGAMLRRETYAQDDLAQAAHPYEVFENRYEVVTVQPAQQQRHGVFAAYPLETWVRHYERDPADPRESHAMTLEVDGYLNPVRTVTVGYGRRVPDADLPTDADREAQARSSVTYTRHALTNAVDVAGARDHYRAPLPADSQTFELTGFAPASGDRFTLEEWQQGAFARLETAESIAFEAQPDLSRAQRRLIEHTRTYYRSDDLAARLPLGVLEPLALPFHSCKLVFTPGLLDAVYQRDGAALLDDAADVLEAGGAARGGYVDLDGNGHWWLPSSRIFFSPDAGDDAAAESQFAREHFYQPQRRRDPFDTDAHRTDFVSRHDAYSLLLQETLDSCGNRSSAVLDYRTLRPVMLTDPNGNRSAVLFDTLGLVVATAVMGKAGEAVGDSLHDVRADLPEADRLAHFAQPLAAPAALLGSATTRLVYDLFAYLRTRHDAQPQPVAVATLAREIHAAELTAGEVSPIQQSLVFTDGLGRQIQSKMLAEPEPGASAPRWRTSGWTLFNNKGAPVRRFEPFFSADARYQGDTAVGQSDLLFHDPLGRVVGTLHANRSWEKLRIGAWRRELWDVNDTALIADPRTDADLGAHFRRLPEATFLLGWHALRTDPAHAAEAAALWPDADTRAAERDAADKAALHAATPGVIHTDALGREALSILHNRTVYSDDVTPPVDQFLATRKTFDVAGGLRVLRDARDRIVVRTDRDLLNRIVRQQGMDTGERWMLHDAASNVLRLWDSRGHRIRTTYDRLRRKRETWLQAGAGSEALIAASRFGEEHPDIPDPAALNLRGRLVEQRDQAGLLLTPRFDFKGNALGGTRRFAREYKRTLDWNTEVPLEDASYSSQRRCDALNREAERVLPDGSQWRARFGAASLVEAVDMKIAGEVVYTPFLDGADYDPWGRRSSATWGNGARSTLVYDAFAPRLLRTRVTRAGGGGGLSSQIFADAGVVHDVEYTYDASGNVTRTRNRALKTLFSANQQVEPLSDYTYDAAYRLVEARGRESSAQSQLALQLPQSSYRDYPFVGASGGPLAVRNYLEQYRYDALGNFESLVHRAAGNDWRRDFHYQSASALQPAAMSNRLTSSEIQAGGAPQAESYAHDAHGNVTAMPHLSAMAWDYRDMLQSVARQVVNDGSAETTWYVYDAGGQRVRKVTERQNGTRRSERLYVGDYELYREFAASGAVSAARETLHVTDSAGRIALVEKSPAGGAGAAPRLIRYQVGTLQRSSMVELDEHARLIALEEFMPYGSPAWQAGDSMAEVASRRYRQNGMERDEETGFNYHGARYYVPWLGRWLNADPLGVLEGPNVYLMGQANPLRYIDLSGMDNSETTQVTPQVRADLDAAGIKYAEQVTFKTTINGKVVQGRFDIVFRDPRPNANGRLVIPELKGMNINELHSNQFDYLPEFEAKGGDIEITSTKGGNISLAKGTKITLKADSFFRVGMENLAEFSATIREASGGKPLTNRFFSADGKFTGKTTQAEFNELLRSKGIDTAKAPKSTFKITDHTPLPPKGGTSTEISPLLKPTPAELPSCKVGSQMTFEEPPPVKMYSFAPGASVTLDPAPKGIVGGAKSLLPLVPKVAETIAKKAGASETVQEQVGFWSSVGVGAIMGAEIGAPAEGIGAIPGAFIGGIIGGVGWISDNYEFCGFSCD